MHRRAYRDRRAATPIPVVALVGYTNAGALPLPPLLLPPAVLAACCAAAAVVTAPALAFALQSAAVFMVNHWAATGCSA